MKLRGLFLTLMAGVLLTAFITVRRETVKENLDVATAASTETLTNVKVFGNLTTIQVFYKNLDAADGSIQFTQSLNGRDFNLIIGAVGTLDNAKNSHMFNIVNLRTDNIRPVFTKGSNTTGEITKIMYNFE